MLKIKHPTAVFQEAKLSCFKKKRCVEVNSVLLDVFALHHFMSPLGFMFRILIICILYNLNDWCSCYAREVGRCNSFFCVNGSTKLPLLYILTVVCWTLTAEYVARQAPISIQQNRHNHHAPQYFSTLTLAAAVNSTIRSFGNQIEIPCE